MTNKVGAPYGNKYASKSYVSKGPTQRSPVGLGLAVKNYDKARHEYTLDQKYGQRLTFPTRAMGYAAAATLQAANRKLKNIEHPTQTFTNDFRERGTKRAGFWGGFAQDLQNSEARHLSIKGVKNTEKGLALKKAAAALEKKTGIQPVYGWEPANYALKPIK